MDKKIYDLIDSYAEDMAKTLCRWIAVPSLKAEGEEGAPFGQEIRRMLDMAMVDAETMGFMTRNYDGYACDIDLGDAPEAVAVLGHLDVVPAGDGWTTPPFTATRVGDKIIGRGTSDDKGPVVAGLYAMKAIKEAGVPLKRTIRMILGTDEESGWEDMEYYCEHAEMPEMGFSPDACFPCINTEKGLLHSLLTAPASAEGLQVKKLFTGERPNVIPGLCEAVVEGGQEVADKAAAYAAKTGLPYTVELTADGVKLVAEGIPGHAAMPEGRRNAIGMLLLMLRELGVEGAFKTLADCVGMETDGASLGVACADELSGPLTNNIGILHLENGTITATLDMRCPVAASLDDIEKTIREKLVGITVKTTEKKAPHHVPADSELVTKLLAAYEEETGDKSGAIAIGGGTYAKVLKQGVAFGAAFPDDEDLAHQADEYITVTGLVRSAKIFANALLRLCAE
ncbi:MAG: dipeptidase PepV [Clostridia bacterium]|nr:dipeptidase PepV [Clostridia bacterium]